MLHVARMIDRRFGADDGRVVHTLAVLSALGAVAGLALLVLH